MNKQCAKDGIDAPAKHRHADMTVLGSEEKRIVSVSGRVVELRGDSVWVKTDSESACVHCAARQGCGVSVLTKVFGRRQNRIRVSNSKNAALGDEIVLAVREGSLLKETFMLYMLPLLSMLVRAAVIKALVNNEMFTVLAAMCGFFAGLAVVRFLSAKNARDKGLEPIMLTCKRVDGNVCSSVVGLTQCTKIAILEET